MAALSTISQAPEYRLHRENLTGADTLPITDGKRGVNCIGYEKLHVQVIPAGGGNPSVEVLFWSSAAGRFVSAHTPLTFAGKGANTPYEFTIDVSGRKAFVAITTLAAGSCKVAVSGYRNRD